MQIRPAQPGDASFIAELQNRAIRDTTHTFTTVEKIAADIALALPRQPYLVASDADALVGFATYFPFRGGPGYARVREHSVYVAPEAQGRGIGADLMAALEAHAKDSGIAHMIGAISGENDAALAFHDRLKFMRVGHLQGVGHKFGREIDLIFVQKRL